MTFPRVIYKKEAQPNSWCRWAVFRVKKRNNSTNIRFVGDTGCQPKGSKVLMSDGSWKNIEEIKIGDEVISPQKDGTNKFSKVTWTTKWICDETYDVCKKNKNKEVLYSCSNNHKIPFFHRFSKRATDKKGKRYELKHWWDFKEYSAEKINLMYQEAFSHKSIGFSSFAIDKFKNRNNCKIEPYTLGVFLGDGMYYYKKKKIKNINYDQQKRKDKKLYHNKINTRLSIESANKEILDYISNFYEIKNTFKKNNSKSIAYEFSTISSLAKQLTNVGLRGLNSGNKFIPKEALLSSLDYRKKLLAGLIDTEGSYECGGYYFTLKSKRLIEDIKNLVYSIGGRCGKIIKVTKRIKKLNFEGTYYSLSCYLGNIKLPIKIKYKQSKGKRFYLEPNRLAITTKKAKKKMVFGFELDSPSHWYITDNWMVTKNSGKSWSALATAEIMAKMMNRTFTTKNIYFSIRGVLDEISENNPKPGTIFLIDEQQVEAGAESHQSKRAKAYTLLLSTVRSKRYIIITTLPFSDMELRKVRRFFHVEVETNGANLTNNTVSATPRYLEYSRLKKDKVYRKMLVLSFIEERSGIRKTRKINKWAIPKPSKELVEAYEEMKREFQMKLYKRLSAELRKEEEPEEDKTPKAVANEEIEDKLTDYQREIFKCLKEGIKVQKEINKILLEKGFTSNHVKVSKNIKWMRKKGVYLMK